MLKTIKDVDYALYAAMKAIGVLGILLSGLFQSGGGEKQLSVKLFVAHKWPPSNRIQRFVNAKNSSEWHSIVPFTQGAKSPKWPLHFKILQRSEKGARRSQTRRFRVVRALPGRTMIAETLLAQSTASGPFQRHKPKIRFPSYLQNQSREDLFLILSARPWAVFLRNGHDKGPEPTLSLL